MDTDERIDLVQKARGELWEDRLNETQRSGRLCAWVSSFHHDLPCRLADNDLRYGSYNAGFKLVFDDGTSWLLRLPRVGRVHDSCADEKVAMEVAVIDLIRRETTIPVPKVQAWGVAAQNPLDLGPFIIMDFIQDGVSLNDLFKDINGNTRLLREDLTDDEMETIYRQFANFLLQLFKLDFDHIGNLDSPSSEIRFPKRPLTWKAHDILQTGGVDTFSIRKTSFSSTTEYFQYVAEQDWEQLLYQPNSTYGRYDAISKYRTFKVLKSLIPDFVHDKYNHTKFKIICDDLGLANLIVRSRQDLTVVGVVDLEWSYVGPAQLFGSAPWWLLMDRPTNQAWDCDNGEPINITARYFRYLGMFERILEEEEAKTPGHESKELSKLIHWSERSGAMWVHMLLTTGFNSPHSFPFTKLVLHIGTQEWRRREREVDENEAATFSEHKVLQLAQYDSDLARIESHATLVDNVEMKKDEFITMHSLFGMTTPYIVPQPSSSPSTFQSATSNVYQPTQSQIPEQEYSTYTSVPLTIAE